METKIHDSHDKARLIIDYTSDLIAITTFTFNPVYTYISPSHKRILGYEPEELIGKAGLDLIHPDDKKRLLPLLKKYINQKVKKLFTGKELEFFETVEFRVKDKSGNWHFLESTVNFVQDELLFISRDITDRKRAEDDLKESARFLSNILSSIQDGISILDKDMKILMVNHTMKEWYAHAMPLVGKKCYEAYYGTTARCNNCPTYKTIMTGEPAHETIPRQGAGGVLLGWQDLYSYPLKDLSTGEFIGVIEYVRDVTEHKKTEKALSESEERFRTLMQQANDAIFIADDTGNIKFWNHKAEELYGYSSAEIIGKPYNVIVPKRFKEIHQQWMEKFSSEDISSISGRIAEGIGERKDGSEFFAEASTAILRQGEQNLLVSIIRDITERKRVEKELQKVEKLESLGVLAGGIAHDFNNIITAILGNVSLAKMSAAPEQKIFKRLTDAEKACERAKDLTQQLLTFAKGGAPIKKMTSIREIIRDTADFALRGAKARCEFYLPEDLWAVEVDEGQISQVMHNLIINADQAMPQGGVITVRAENIQVADQQLKSVPAGNYVVVSIQDQGVGIAKEYIAKVFDPFFTTKQKGSGLGLASSYSIIINHGGYITAQSETGAGSTFTFYLPASGQQVETHKTDAECVTAGSGKILVMDDEQMIRDLAGEVLKALGYEACLSKDGAEAIELYRQSQQIGKPFAAVILDLTVPGGVGGEEALKNLREIDPGVKAIVSSGYSNDPIMADFEKYGFSGFIPKPYKIADMSAILNDVIHKSRM